MLSAVSGLALALVANRRLAIDWEEPFVGLFDPPFEWRPRELVPPVPGWDTTGRRGYVHLTAHSPGTHLIPSPSV